MDSEMFLGIKINSYEMCLLDEKGKCKITHERITKKIDIITFYVNKIFILLQHMLKNEK